MEKVGKEMSKNEVERMIVNNYCLSLSKEELEKMNEHVEKDLSIGEQSTSDIK